MAGKSKPLRGRSELIRPDGTIVPVRDFDGNLVINPAEWEQIKQQIAKNLSRTVSEIVTHRPERKAAYGIPEGQNTATVCLIDILGIKKAPDGAGTTDECKEN
nr:hypothetical protein [uncultured Agathobaculum sp.]